MHVNELRSMTPEALQNKLKELSLELSVQKRKVASTGVQNKKAKIRELRRTIAQIHTILYEKGVKA